MNCLADISTVQVVGYSARAVNAAETPDWSQIPFIIQTLGPLLAPALYAASIYMLLGRIIGSLRAEHLSFIPVRWLTKIFVFGDVLSFAFQCIGQSSGMHNKHFILTFTRRRDSVRRRRQKRD